MYKIKSLPEDQQPREKLMKSGVQALSLEDLLAIILGTGYKKENVLELSKRIFKDYGSKTITGYSRVLDVMTDFELPKVKACQVLACFEIGRRVFADKSIDIPTISSPQDVWEFVSDMHNLKKEYLRGLYLNIKNQIIHDEIISIGTLDQSIAHPRDIFVPAIKYHAAAMIIVHNHPSGDATPSKADIVLTEKIKSAGELLSISVLDHIVVTRSGYRSI
ncbi:MAG: DNA repair protein RadC [Candidatus Paceibacterota bacterium]